MFFLKNIFETLTLQTGTIVLSSQFITLAVNVLLVNLLSFEAETPLAWIIMFLFVLFMFIIWIIAFFGAYEESYKVISAAVISWTVYVVVWVGLVVLSIMNTQSNKSICLECKCPDGLWLLYNSRYDLNTENQLNDSSRAMKESKNYEQPQYEKKIKPQTINTDIIKYKLMAKNNENNMTTTEVALVTMPNESIGNVKKKLIEVKDSIVVIDTCCETPSIPKSHIASQISSGILSVLYALILIFSWMVLIGYRKEIQLQKDFTSNVEEIFPTN